MSVTASHITKQGSTHTATGTIHPAKSFLAKVVFAFQNVVCVKK
jgi:hypothetical protein